MLQYRKEKFTEGQFSEKDDIGITDVFTDTRSSFPHLGGNRKNGPGKDRQHGRKIFAL